MHVNMCNKSQSWCSTSRNVHVKVPFFLLSFKVLYVFSVHILFFTELFLSKYASVHFQKVHMFTEIHRPPLLYRWSLDGSREVGCQMYHNARCDNEGDSHPTAGLHHYYKQNEKLNLHSFVKIESYVYIYLYKYNTI